MNNQARVKKIKSLLRECKKIAEESNDQISFFGGIVFEEMCTRIGICNEIDLSHMVINYLDKDILSQMLEFKDFISNTNPINEERLH